VKDLGRDYFVDIYNIAAGTDYLMQFLDNNNEDSISL
jgi:hypothetical protein